MLHATPDTQELLIDTSESITCSVFYKDKITISWGSELITVILSDLFFPDTFYTSTEQINPHALFSVFGVRLVQKTKEDSVVNKIHILLTTDKNGGSLLLNDFYYEIYNCNPREKEKNIFDLTMP